MASEILLSLLFGQLTMATIVFTYSILQTNNNPIPQKITFPVVFCGREEGINRGSILSDPKDI